MLIFALILSYNINMNYCPLNILTGYTFLSSTLKVEDIYNVCEIKNYPFFGTCDLNNVHAFPELDKLNSSFKTSPIFGATIKCFLFDELEVFISLYITSEEGYLNLIKIISNYQNGISLYDLNKHKEGLIIIIPTTSNSELLSAIKNSSLDKYSNEISLLINGFNKGYLGIEIYSEQDIVYANKIRSFAKKYNFEVVAFNRHQYINKNDAIGLKILDAIKYDTKLQSKVENGPYYFISEKAIKQLYSNEEIDNTYLIAKSCQNFKLNIKRGKLLNYDLKDDKKNYIKSLCINKLNKLNINDEKYLSRLNYELDIIEKMGYLDYFLIVQDYVNYAKNNGIPVGPGRGSSAGSLTSFLLGITNIDSLKYDLLFERFLNPMRVSMPDIDIDFADYRRDDIISYLKNKYGNQRVANIVTFQTLGPKASVRDIGRVFNLDNRDINLISNCIGDSPSFQQGLTDNYELKQLYEDSYYKEIIDLSRKIEKLPRQAGIHAAGIIVNDSNLDSSLPVSKLENGSLITQYEGPFLEGQGFLKMDILGLTNLTLIESMISYIKKHYDPYFDINAIPLNDQNTFKILNNGLTSGIFQLESAGISKTLKEVNISSFDDIVVTLALYRPGPMDNIPLYAKTKNEKLNYKIIHPLLKPILSSTYGVIVYQEQIMQIVQVIAGFNLGQADLFRRAISKKDINKLHSLKNEFIEGALGNNIEIKVAEEVFELIERFANYGFNKAHSVSYALITYQMAYIKANYPLAFFASILNNQTLNDFKVIKFRQEFTYFGINLKLPSIIESKKEMTFKDNSLIISFSKIKGLNKKIIDDLINIQKYNPINFASFMQFAYEYKIPESAIISLINSGCFDVYNKSRATLRNAVSSYRMFYETFSQEGILTREEMHDFLPIIKEVPEDDILKLDLEFQTLGIILSGSILEKYKHEISKRKILTLTEQLNLNVSFATVAAIVNNIRITKTKKNEKMAILNCQDDSRQFEIVLFPKTYSKYSFWIKEKNVYIFKGILKNEENLSLICDEIINMENKK